MLFWGHFYQFSSQAPWLLRGQWSYFTDDTAVAELLKSLRVHGKGDNKYDNVRLGLNSRLDTIQARF